jgi:hypothetical protein
MVHHPDLNTLSFSPRLSREDNKETKTRPGQGEGIISKGGHSKVELGRIKFEISFFQKIEIGNREVY